jgi:hypothetical protein
MRRARRSSNRSSEEDTQSNNVREDQLELEYGVSQNARSESLTIIDVFSPVIEDESRDAFDLLQGAQFDLTDDVVFEEDSTSSANQRFSESLNFSENSVNTPQDAEPLKYHADQEEGEEEEAEEEEAPKKSKARMLLGVLGAAGAAAFLVARTIFSKAPDNADSDVPWKAATGEERAAPLGDQGAYDGGGDYGTGTSGGEYMPQGAPGDGGGGAVAGTDGGVVHFPAGTQTGAALPPDGGAAFADVGGLYIAPQNPASTPPPNPAP